MKVSINEYRVENINWFKEHEGLDAFQCDIIHSDEKIGFFSEDYMNGPDNYNFITDYDEELKKLREASKSFFKEYSKEEELFMEEDFFIRFLASLNEATEKAKEGQSIIINTNYPYDYKIDKTSKLMEPTIKQEKDYNQLMIPVVAFNLNLQTIKEIEKENDVNEL